MITNESFPLVEMFITMIFIFGPIILLAYGYGIRSYYSARYGKQHVSEIVTETSALPVAEDWIVINPRQLNGKMEITRYDD